jgi:acetylornithine/succinyldiaminopimelate/putrescine aminotransferase
MQHLSNKQIFYEQLALTSDAPMGIEIEKAEGIYLYGTNGERYIDMISGVSVSHIGHGNPHVKQAIKDQVDQYMHLMVYGEYIQAPQVRYAHALCQTLAQTRLNQVYFVNSGSEAIDGALKLAKRYTGRAEIVCFTKAYHGSTHAALSMNGSEYFKNAFRPLVPGIRQLEWNSQIELQHITTHTAAVCLETMQGEGGIRIPDNAFLQALRTRCTETGTLLILDEVQTAFGRTGKMYAFEHAGIEPDILVLGKALGGGMPLGAFIAPAPIMQCLRNNPFLGHITTFGGHPVCCAAGLAALEVVQKDGLCANAAQSEQLFRDGLQHPAIQSIRGKGLFLAVELRDAAMCSRVLREAASEGLLMDPFLFCDTSFRIAPPLCLTPTEAQLICQKLLRLLEKCSSG